MFLFEGEQEKKYKYTHTHSFSCWQEKEIVRFYWMSSFLLRLFVDEPCRERTRKRREKKKKCK